MSCSETFGAYDGAFGRFALLVQTMGERGLKGALVALVTVVACIPLAIFKVKAHAVAVHRGMALGVAK